ASCHDNGIRTERTNFHRRHVLGCDPFADACIIKNQSEEFPTFVFCDKPGYFIAANLLVQSVKQLLASCCACESCSVVHRAAETSEVQKAFRCTVEHDAHAVKQTDDFGCSICHRFNRLLVSEEIA